MTCGAPIEIKIEILKQYPIMQYFGYLHLPDHLQLRSKCFYTLAWLMVEDGDASPPETAAGLRKLLEAKDCFVRAML